MRLPYAMRTMIEEISTVCEDALFETQNPDGYDVWRDLVIDPATTQTIGPLLNILVDQRIIPTLQVRDDGRWVVRFVDDPRADDRRPFGLDAAYRIMTG